MSLTLASNISSLRAQTNLSRTSVSLSDTFERLSSGLRINKASDDAAGLAIADSLRADAQVAAVAIRNANDGVSLISIADQALSSIATVLTRMEELATQSANGSYTTTQRSALASEFLALGSEIERIAITTTFNDMKLLSASSSVTLQVGLTGGSTSQITIPSIIGTLSSIGLSSGGSSTLTYSINASSSDAAVSASRNAMTAVSSALNNVSLLRGTIGAAESRLGVAITNLQVARENFIAAESRIRDIDVAGEVAQMVRLKVLQESGVAILAQANQQPQVVMKLLE